MPGSSQPCPGVLSLALVRALGLCSLSRLCSRLPQKSPACETHPHGGAGRPRGDRGAAGCRVGRLDFRDPRLQRPRGAGTRLFGHPAAGGAGLMSTRGYGLLLGARAHGALGQDRPSLAPLGDGHPVTRRELRAHRMGTHLGWGAQPAHPKADCDL